MLKKHNALQGIPSDDKIEVDETESTVGASTFKTFDTFASDWSNCSNISFSRYDLQIIYMFSFQYIIF